jgi:hypothetical protein
MKMTTRKCGEVMVTTPSVTTLLVMLLMQICLVVLGCLGGGGGGGVVVDAQSQSQDKYYKHFAHIITLIVIFISVPGEASDYDYHYD